MNAAELEALKAAVLALDFEALEEPRLPIAVALQEANDLHTYIVEDPTVLPRLTAVGLDAALAGKLGAAVEFAREMQSRWVVTRDRNKPEAQREREARGVTLRRELHSAASWSLREERAAVGTLSAISEGEGVADLIQDLSDLAELIERKRDAFSADSTFDASASVEEARSLAQEIAAGVSVSKLDGESAKARDLRDRAYTYLAEMVDEVRAAGRHAYRKDEGLLKHFTSRYLLRRRRARAAKKAKTPA